MQKTYLLYTDVEMVSPATPDTGVDVVQESSGEAASPPPLPPPDTGVEWDPGGVGVANTLGLAEAPPTMGVADAPPAEPSPLAMERRRD